MRDGGVIPRPVMTGVERSQEQVVPLLGGFVPAEFTISPLRDPIHPPLPQASLDAIRARVAVHRHSPAELDAVLLLREVDRLLFEKSIRDDGATEAIGDLIQQAVGLAVCEMRDVVRYEIAATRRPRPPAPRQVARVKPKKAVRRARSS